jgi:branched-chain amino acid transport system substrate-binding protein
VKCSIRLLAAALGAFALAALPLAGRAVDPYEINVIIPLTGPASFLGKAEQTSLGVVERSVNAGGGIAGRPIAFTIVDDQSNPQIAIQLLNGVVAKNVPVVLGSTLDAVCRAMAAVVRSGGPLHYCFSNAFHPEEGSWSYSSSFSTVDVDATAMRFFRGHGWNKIAYIASTDATGQDFEAIVDGLLTRPENKNVTIVAREHFNVADISVAAQMSRIKASGAQALFAFTTGTPFATLLRGIQNAGIDLPVLTSSGNETYAQARSYASFMPRELYYSGIPSLTPDQLPRGAVRSAIERYQEAFKPTGIRPDIGANQAWDAALIVVDALRKYGTGATAAQIRDYISKLRRWSGINGEYDFPAIPQRGVGGNWIMVQRWDSAADAFVGVSRPGGLPR